MKARKNDYFYIAAKDLVTAQKTYLINEFSATAFYAQQTIEKSLKFVLDNSEEDVNLKTHNLRTLCRLVENTLPNIKVIKSEIGNISDFYFDSRYPGADYYEPDLSEAATALLIAQTVFEMVSDLVDNLEDVAIPNLKQHKKTSFFTQSDSDE